MQLQITEDRVVAAAFDGEACAICMASASLLCDIVPGKPVSHLDELHDLLQAALDNEPDIGGIEELKPLLGVKRYPSRIRCATLPWLAASRAL